MGFNASRLIEWEERMMETTGLCGAALLEALAEAAGEEGRDEPSNAAIALANQWERNPALIGQYIRSSARWCQAPTVGCRSDPRCKHILGPNLTRERRG